MPALQFGEQRRHEGGVTITGADRLAVEDRDDANGPDAAASKQALDHASAHAA
jgi:hypothetical protein